MAQRIEPLSAKDKTDVEAKRMWVKNHYAPAKQDQYETVAGKLRLLDTIVRQKWIAANETLKLQCLGIAFGDALAQEMGLQWVAVDDEFGRDPALQVKGTSLLVFPLTSISKRIERGDEVDVYQLFGDAMKKIAELKEKGY